MKTYLALLLILLPVAATYAANNDTSSEKHGKAAANPAKALAEQINDITHSPTLTLKEKDDQVSAAVRDAINEAIAHLTDSADILKITLELTTAAAKAAPSFTHAILEGISTVNAITTINGAINQIKAAVIEAATKAAAAAFDSDNSRHDRDRDRDREHEDHDHDPDDHVVSPSR